MALTGHRDTTSQSRAARARAPPKSSRVTMSAGATQQAPRDPDKPGCWLGQREVEEGGRGVKDTPAVPRGPQGSPAMASELSCVWELSGGRPDLPWVPDIGTDGGAMLRQ